MTHRILLAVPFLLGISVFLFLLGGAVHNPDVSSNEIIHARKEPLVVWTSYQGQLESNTVSTIMSRFRGTATIIDIVPEGVRISKDDVLVRFDSSDLERELVKLERDVTLARLELNGLEKAELPLELKNIEVELTKADLDYETEFQYLEESIKLAEEGLVSDQEVKKQKLKVNEIAMQRNTLRMQKKLTEEYLHPSRLEQARATLDSAEQEYELTNSQLEESIIRAPMDGVTSYRPISVGGEFRPVRIGDTVFPNQPFMVIPNINDLVIQIEVPENELSRVQEGNKVIVRTEFPAAPGLAEILSRNYRTRRVRTSAATRHERDSQYLFVFQRRCNGNPENDREMGKRTTLRRRRHRKQDRRTPARAGNVQQ
jgi:multidrug efflux pump subunit AcrA (membrane-fusion protein)